MTGASALASLGDQVEQADPDGVSKGSKQAVGGELEPMTGWRRFGSPRRRRGYVRASVVAAFGAALALFAYDASAASTATLTATAVHITDHSAYVEAVVDFSGPGLTPSQTRATDPNPSDGTGGVLVSYPDVASRVSLVTAHGVAIRVVVVPYALSVGIGALPGAFKYLSYGLAASGRLVIDVWKSTFASSGNIFRGQGGCPTLSRVDAASGTVSASGSTVGLFENQFRVVVRDAFGAVLASRSVSAIGRWRVTLHYTAPQGQGGSFEAAARSAKDGALACLVQEALALPASNARANLKVVYRAYADVNGDGRLDLVRLRRTGASKGELTVALRGGGRLSVATPSDAVWLPGLAASGNVDGRPGEELFVDVVHVTTAESISIYTDWRGSLVRAGTLSAYGNDYGVLYGITCSVAGSRHLVTEHGFSIKFGTRSWMRQDTVYSWKGPALKVFARGPARRMRGAPPPALVGVQCGHPPRLAAASEKPGRTAVGVPPSGGQVPAGAAPASVSFVSSSTAFVLGSTRCGHAPCTLVLRTRDRGRSWSRVSAPGEAISVPNGNGLWGLRFAECPSGLCVRCRAVADQRRWRQLGADEGAGSHGARVRGRAGPRAGGGNYDLPLERLRPGCRGLPPADRRGHVEADCRQREQGQHRGHRRARQARLVARRL